MPRNCITVRMCLIHLHVNNRPPSARQARRLQLDGRRPFLAQRTHRRRSLVVLRSLYHFRGTPPAPNVHVLTPSHLPTARRLLVSPHPPLSRPPPPPPP